LHKVLRDAILTIGLRAMAACLQDRRRSMVVMICHGTKRRSTVMTTFLRDMEVYLQDRRRDIAGTITFRVMIVGGFIPITGAMRIGGVAAGALCL
jgi:hypothetical protein